MRHNLQIPLSAHIAEYWKLQQIALFDMNLAMMPRDINSPAHFRWSRRTGRIIDAICFCILMLVVGTVIYGLLLRALYEHSYYGAAALAILGALVMLIGLAQQTIAARDAATWRAMAEWQIRAARTRSASAAQQMHDADGPSDPNSSLYYEHLLEALIIDIQETGRQEWGGQELNASDTDQLSDGRSGEHRGR